MDKVRFSCPRCRTVMQTSAEKIGFDVACPNCAHRFRLVDSPDSPPADKTLGPDAATIASSRLPPEINSGDHTKPPVGSFPEVGTASSDPIGQSAIEAMHDATAVPAQPGYSGPSSFSCPYCHTTAPPLIKSEVSTGGWIVFAVLLMTTCVGCVIGLMIRDQYRICSQCKIRLG